MVLMVGCQPYDTMYGKLLETLVQPFESFFNIICKYKLYNPFSLFLVVVKNTLLMYIFQKYLILKS